MSQQQPQSPSAGQPGQPQGQPQTDGLLEIVAAAVILAIALPAILVGAVLALATRRASRRTLAIVGGIAAVAGAVEALAWPGWRAVLTRYGAALTTVVNAVEHHAHKSVVSALAGTLWAAVPALAGTLWAAVPAGLIFGVAYRAYAQHASNNRAKSQPTTGAPVASAKQLAPLVVPAPTAGRVILGKLNGKLLASQLERHVAIVAPTRSGKTRGLIMPAVLDWQGPVIVTSAKSDLLWDPTYQSGTYAHRKRLGPVWVFDPSGSSGWPCVQWSPLGQAETWQGALRAAHTMVQAERPVGAGEESSGTSRFFAQRAAAVLAPCLHAVTANEGGMRDALELIRSSGDLVTLAGTLADELVNAEPEAQSAVEALRVGSELSSGDVMATVANLLAPFDDPQVAKATSDCELDIEELLSENGTLYVVAGTDNQRLAPLFACLLDEIFTTIRAKALREGPLSPRILMALDEVANIAPVPGLPSLLSTVGGLGVTIITAWQSISQMQRWGQKAQSEILGNSACQLWTATDDPETSEHLSRALGKVLVQTQSVTANAQRGWFAKPNQDRSVSTSWTERSVLDPSQSRLLTGPLLVAHGLPPTEIEWRFHDQDRVLRAKSSMPLPAIQPVAEPDVVEDEPAGIGSDDEDWLSAYMGRA